MSDQLSKALLDYLRKRTGEDSLIYAQPPEVLAGGFDAAIFSFSLITNERSLSGPMVLRLFERGRRPAMTRKEAAVQNVLAAMGYPAPDVRIEEQNPDILGGAFLIMPRLPGRALAAAFERLSREKHGILWIISTARQIMRETGEVWDDAQTRLHALDPDDFLARIEKAGLDLQAFDFDAELARFKVKVPPAHEQEFAPGFAWLEYNKPPQATRVICHGDLQPLNVLANDGKLSGVLDWGATVVAHPAVDYGAVVAIMAAAPVPGPAIARPFIRVLMNKLAHDHARPYFARHTDGHAALRYFAAYNCMAQLASVAAPRGPSAARGGAFRSATGVRNLIRGFRRYSGVGLKLSPEALFS
jgi:aminoglycoside phosphotransferase (APT) family kinase protein